MKSEKKHLNVISESQEHITCSIWQSSDCLRASRIRFLSASYNRHHHHYHH